jgi:hypothetical protein
MFSNLLDLILGAIFGIGIILIGLALFANKLRQVERLTVATNPLLRFLFLIIGTLLLFVAGHQLFFHGESNSINLMVDTPPITRPSTSSPYPVLERLLASQSWKAANQKTFNLMQDARHREQGLTKNAINQFPCQNLKDIDRLWVRYSEAAFGFSIQEKLLDSTGDQLLHLNQQDIADAYRQFALQVGWRDSNGWKNMPNFTLNAPKGHLPRIEFTLDKQGRPNNTLVPLDILLHAETCKLQE